MNLGTVREALPLAALAAMLAASAVPAEARSPKVACDPGKITIESFSDGQLTLDCFIDQEDYEPNPWITPSLAGILSTNVLSAENADGGTAFQIGITLESEQFGCARGGTIHFRDAGGRTYAKPVPVGLKGECEAEAEEEPQGEVTEEEGELLESKVIYLLDDEEITELTREDLLAHNPLEITVCSKCVLDDPEFWLTPNIAQYFDVEIEAMEPDDDTREGETKYLVTLTLKDGVNPETLSVQGTGHLRGATPPRRTCPIPLKIRIKTGDDVSEQVVPGIVVGSAELKQRAIAPGEIISVFGKGLGPASLKNFTIGPDGKLPEYLGETLVLFDGIPAPLLATSDEQVNAVVPYDVAGRPFVEMLLIYNGEVSTPFLLPVKKASPGVFTMNASGKGQGAVLNQNLTVNSFKNPALPGSIVVIYATGFGELLGGSESGALVGDEPGKVIQPVKVLIGGVISELLYAGGSPGLVNSVIQLNVRLPYAAQSGTGVPIVLLVGDERSTGLTTLAIQ